VITAAEVALLGLLWPEYGETFAAEGEADWPPKAALGGGRDG